MCKKILPILLFLCFLPGFSQPISLYRQFAGSYDFTMIGNTLMSDWHHNPCTILNQSSAVLNLNTNQTVAAAYLYWSGLGSPEQADLDVALNGTPITAQRVLTNIEPIVGESHYSAFADVTNLVKTTGNGTYLFSDFNALIPDCTFANNFIPLNYSGWAIVIIYEDPTLSGRMVNIYDGLEFISPSRPVSINLDRLNMTDTSGAKLGFLVWDGQNNLSGENLQINNNEVSNPPLNPVNNVYNGTDSWTGSNALYHMDLDYFDISSYISVNNMSINIETFIPFSGGSDVVGINVFALTLINQLPDATIVLDKVGVECGSRDVQISYTVFNTNASTVLPANTSIAFYANGILLAITATKNSISIKGSERGTVTLSIPTTVDDDFVLTASVDDDGSGNSSVDEINEDNNTDTENVTLKFSPEINQPEDIVICDEQGKGFIIFDLTAKYSEISTANDVSITFHESSEDAEKGVNRINAVGNYELESHSSKVIWVRAENKDNKCAAITFFTITAQMKPFHSLQEPLMLCNLKNNPSTVNLAHSHFLLSKMYPYLDEIDFKFYETESNAESEINEITNVNNYQPFVFPHIVWVKVKGKTNLWCEKIFQLQLNDCLVPKGISPNGDGLNDGFDIAVFNPMDLKIFNRYGTEVYKYGLGYTNQWHGQDKNNKQLPSGTYFYSFKTLFDTYIGYVYIMREVN